MVTAEPGEGARVPSRNTVSGGSAGTVVQSGSIGEVHFHQAAAQSAPRLIPRQIPPPRGAFVNRSAELAALREEAARLVPDRPRIAVLTGLSGVGKTELVARWADEDRVAFPDGALYADLGAVRQGGGVDLGAVAAGFLRSLGVDGDRIPASVADRVAEFRTATAGLRIVVFLDGAEQPAEVRALTPSSGLVVVTSRRRLDGLVLDGARVLTVDPLTPGAGEELVRRWLGDDRGSERDRAELVRLCGGIPLALQAVGRQLIGRRHLRLDRVIAELARRRDQLRPIIGGEGNEVDDALESVYAHLPDRTRHLYHLIGVHPGPHISTHLARAAGAEDADETVGDLLDAHLVTEVGEDRFRCPELVQQHARRRAALEWSAERRDETLGLILDHYLRWTAAADRLVLGDRFRLQPPPPASAFDEVPFTDGVQALSWLDDERADLLALLRAASASGRHATVWTLCESLWALYHSRKHYADWIEAHHLGVESAQWDGRPDAEIRMRNQLARAHYELGELDAAAEELDRAAERVPSVGEPVLRGMLWETQGLLCGARGRADEAVEFFSRALDANDEAQDAHGHAVQSYNLAQALLDAGRAHEALTVAQDARAGVDPERDAPMVMRLTLVLARVHQALGDLPAALAAAHDAAGRAARLDLRAKERDALDLAAALADRTGDTESAATARARLRALTGGAAPRPDEATQAAEAAGAADAVQPDDGETGTARA
jgi:tetratricopeptide (TPR) repeat protein